MVVAFGLFNAYPTMEIVLRSPRLGFLLQISPSWLSSGLWAVIFIAIGIAIGRAARWIRPILLGVMPAYIVLNIGQAMVDIRLHQGFMVFPEGLPSNVAHIVALVSAGLIFVWFCTPQIDGAFTAANAKSSRLAELPLPLAAWAVGCVALGFFMFIQIVLFMLREVGIRAMHPRYLLLSSILAFGGALTLSLKRYALIAASLCLLIQSMQGAITVFTQMIVGRQPMGRGGSPDMFLACIVPGIHALLLLAAALFGFYAARFLKQPSSNAPSV